MRLSVKRQHRAIALVLTILAGGVLCVWWMVSPVVRTALPVGMALALSVLLAVGAMAARSGSDNSIKSIQRRLMIPLAVMLFLLLGLFYAVLATQQMNNLNESSRQVVNDVFRDVGQLQAERSRMLAALEEVLVHEASLRRALKAGDRERLLATYGPVFEKLRTDYAVTHCYFLDENRLCLVRIHNPARYGDRIDRFTVREAARTGRTVSGFELGLLGTFTLRVVRPVYCGGSLIGYLELGKEIEDILGGIRRRPGVEVAVTIRKSVLKRGAWEDGMKMLGREAEWDRFAEDVLIYSSVSPFPATAKSLEGPEGRLHGNATVEIASKGKWWRVMAEPLVDVSGVEVGDLLILHDVSALKASYVMVMAFAGGGGLLLVSGLFGLFFVVLRRTDRGVLARQTELRENADKLRRMLDGTIKAMISVLEVRDPYTAGHERRVARLASAIGTKLGLSAEQVEGILVAAYVHDIGKISVPTEILSKPGKLNADELAIIKTHSQVGYDIIKDIDFIWPVAQMVLQHHERMDGSGYPQGLKGEQIMLEARILAVADVVEAMSSHRPYRPALGTDKALAEINEKKGLLYDPVCVDACGHLFRDEQFQLSA